MYRLALHLTPAMYTCSTETIATHSERERETEREVMDAGVFSVLMEGGRPWGFTLQGGLEFHSPLRVGRVS